MGRSSTRWATTCLPAGSIVSFMVAPLADPGGPLGTPLPTVVRRQPYRHNAPRHLPRLPRPAYRGSPARVASGSEARPSRV